MKVHAVSFRSNTHAEDIKKYSESKGISPFLYTMDTSAQKDNVKGNSFRLLTAFLAAIAVGITLYNIKGKKQFPKEIVEISGKDSGLNKIKKYRKSVEGLKEKVLYPLMATIKGDKRYIQHQELKSGIVITGSTIEDAKVVVNAFCEHAEKLGLRVKKAIPERTPEGKLTRFTERNVRVKMVYNAIKEAYAHYKSTGKYTVVNIDNISLLANLKTSKPTSSKFETFLKAINQNDYPGVIWIACNPKSTSLPYFFNNIPVFMTKLID